VFRLLPLKDWLYLGAIIAIVSGLLWWHHSGVLAGEARIKAQDAAAVAKHDQDVAAQKVKDQEDATDAVSQLQQELESLRAAVSVPTPGARPIRLCQYAGGDTGRPTSSPPGGTKPAESSNQGSDYVVRNGTGSGDIGPAMRDLASAGEILAIYRERTAEWALKQSK
jgi:hypothetical protein